MLKPAACVVSCLLVVGSPALGQIPPFNAVEVGSWFEAGHRFGDVWGDGNFAYVGHDGQRVVSIVDITDPTAPILAARYDAGVTGSAQDVKVADGLMFVGLETSNLGCQIVDVRNPYLPVRLTDVDVMNSVHNVFYDQGWLFLVDAVSPTLEIVDLRNYDPDDAPIRITASTWTLTGVGERVHDITVRDGRLYAAAWDSLRVYDTTNLATEAPTFLGSAPGYAVHSSWPTDDGRFLVVAEEHVAGGLELYEIVEHGDSVSLVERDYFHISTLDTTSVHNPLVDGYRVYASFYAAGVQVLDIDPVTKTFVPVASFDTTPDTGQDGLFAGCWGVYPFLGADKVLATDRSLGLSVIEVDPQLLTFDTAGSLSPVLGTTGPATVTVGVDAVGSAVDGASVVARWSLNGVAQPDLALAEGDPGRFSATLPSVSCGDEVELDFSARNQLGTTFMSPESLQARVTEAAETVLRDDFELDLGWTANNNLAISGGWTRAPAVGTGAQPGFGPDGDGAGSIFHTGAGGETSFHGSHDLDRGPIYLISPILDLSEGSAWISFSYWFFCNNLNDILRLEASVDGVTWLPVLSLDPDQGGWRRISVSLDGVVPPSATTRLRFVLDDTPSDSITEAAVDDVWVQRLQCSGIFADGFETGSIERWSSAAP